jgi:hypothetical protein
MIPLNNIVAAAKDVGVNFIVMGSAFGAGTCHMCQQDPRSRESY